MIMKLRERMAKGEEGFTLIELLVVMLIIGILAAIAIPTFFNQKQKAQDADTKAMAHTAQTAIETYATDNGGKYTGATPALLKGIEQTIDQPNVTVVSATDNGYEVQVKNPTTTHTFNIKRDGATGAFSYTCLPVGNGGCPTSGNWGQ
ncbi:MAG: type II secretion system protein [Solirubrobacterales bacterium]